MAMGAAEEHRDASVGRWKVVTLRAPAALCGLIPACGRTGAVGGPHRVAPRAAGQRPAAQLVSTQALGEVHRRMLTRMGAPQVGQRAAGGCEGVRCGGWPSRGGACMILRRLVASGMAQLAWRKPQWRTCMKPSGKTCWRNRRRNAMTSRWAVRGRALPTFRSVKVTVRSLRPTIRLLEIATRKTDGAREVKAEWPWWAA